MPITFTNNVAFNCDTVISLPETADANLSNNLIIACRQGIEVRSTTQDILQNLPS